MKTIILDTNFLMIPFEFRVDIFTEIDRICQFTYKLCVMEGTLRELHKLEEKESGKNRQAAHFALEILKRKSLNILQNSSENVDDSILSSCDEDTIVATQDQGLKKRLKKKHIRIIVLRNKNYLELI